MLNIAPENTQVIALIAAFNHQQELLLLKRPDGVHCGGLWSFPGGKVESNEMPLQAAIREFKEETALTGKRWRHLGKSSHTYHDRTLNFLFFVCHCPDVSNIRPESKHIWIKRDKLNAYPMPEGNKKLTAMLFTDILDEYLESYQAL